MKIVEPGDFTGNYIHYGIREHAMAAIMNGLALYKGFIPYGGTFLVFSDYCRPAIRLSALMSIRVIYVMTHDSIGVGEDGPTHQPVEHLSALRSIPNLNVLRPADAAEVAECWEIALTTNGPSVLVLTRQSVPYLRPQYSERNLSSKGAYVLYDSKTEHVVVDIYATGSELQIALETVKLLQNNNISARAISVPCQELFAKQNQEYINKIIPRNSLKVVIEAGLEASWGKFLSCDDIFIGMNNFGLSAPGNQLFKYFNITVEYTVEIIMNKLNNK